MIRPFRGVHPQIHPTAYVDPSAQVIGDVHLGEEASIWCNCTVRGDIHHIRIGDRSNVQDNSVIHVRNGTHPTILEHEVTVGHSVTLHGCYVERGCLIGIGAILLDLTPTATFDRLVPVLILFATCLFMAQEPLQRRFNLVDAHRSGSSPWSSWTMPFQLVVSIYGGYFGAGMGILMLAALTLMGHTDIHRMNGVKNLLAAAINGTAAIYFAFNTTIICSSPRRRSKA